MDTRIKETEETSCDAPPTGMPNPNPPTGMPNMASSATIGQAGAPACASVVSSQPAQLFLPFAHLNNMS